MTVDFKGFKANIRMSPTVSHGMILAAGFGSRLGSIVESIPKALVKIGTQPIINKLIAEMHEVGIGDIVVNTHYCHDVLSEHLSSYDMVQVSHEPEILGTAGGIIRAMNIYCNDVMLIVNCDFFSYNTVGVHPFELLINRWESANVMQSKIPDVILLLMRREDAKYHYGKGDFSITQDDKIYIDEGENTHVFTGVYICAPRFYLGCAVDEYLEMPAVLKMRLEDKSYHIDYVIVDDTKWIDIGTPETLNRARYEAQA